MMNIRRFSFTLLSSALAGALAVAPLTASAWNSRDGTLEIHGFLDNTWHHRDSYGITKERVRGQVEWSKIFKPVGLFSELSLSRHPQGHLRRRIRPERRYLRQAFGGCGHDDQFRYGSRPACCHGAGC